MMNFEKLKKMAFEDPAKFIGWVVASIISLAAILVAILQNVIDLLPSSWKQSVNGAIVAILTIGVIATRIQAVLTNAKVYSPAAVANDPTFPALKGTHPGTTQQGGPQTEEEGQKYLDELRAQLGIKK